MNDDNLAKAALAFGGGIARRQSECGALVGGVMALGLRLGANVTLERDPAAEAAGARLRQEASNLLDAFATTFGETYCRKLTGYDFSSPEDNKRFRADTETRSRCRDFSAFVVKYLTNLGI